MVAIRSGRITNDTGTTCGRPSTVVVASSATRADATRRRIAACSIFTALLAAAQGTCAAGARSAVPPLAALAAARSTALLAAAQGTCAAGARSAVPPLAALAAARSTALLAAAQGTCAAGARSAVPPLAALAAARRPHPLVPPPPARHDGTVDSVPQRVPRG